MLVLNSCENGAYNREVLIKYTNKWHLLRRREAEKGLSPEPRTQGSLVSEPEEVPKGELKSESETEPEVNVSKYSTEPEPENWPEPGPRWQQAYQLWKWGWEFHVYFFATTYLMMGLYAGYFVVFNIYDGLNKKYLSVSLNIMVLVFGLSRALVLYFDPYHQGNLINALIIMRFIWSIGGPCLTTADSLVILALVETAKVSLAPPRFQKPGNILVVVIIHFILVLLSDTIVSLYVDAKIMLLLCQIFFVLWGGFLGLGYFLLGYKLDKKLFRHKQVKEKEDYIYIYLIYASGFANIFIVLIMLYSAAGVFGVYSGITFVDAWPWYAFQTVCRISETISCILVFTVSAKRTRVKKAMEQYKVWNSNQTNTAEKAYTDTVIQHPKTKFAKALEQVRLKPKKILVSPLLNNPTDLACYSELETDKTFTNRLSHHFKPKRQLRTGKRQMCAFQNTLSFSHLQNTWSSLNSQSENARQIGAEFQTIGLENSVAENDNLSEAGGNCSSTDYQTNETDKFAFKIESGFKPRVFSALQQLNDNTSATKRYFDTSNNKIDSMLSRKTSFGRQNKISASEQNNVKMVKTGLTSDDGALGGNDSTAKHEVSKKSSVSPRGRARRMSMFSSLHQQKLNFSFQGADLQTGEIIEQDSDIEISSPTWKDQ